MPETTLYVSGVWPFTSSHFRIYSILETHLYNTHFSKTLSSSFCFIFFHYYELTCILFLKTKMYFCLIICMVVFATYML